MTLTQNKIFFLSNGPFGAKVLLELAQNQFPLDLILTTPDKKSGRGQILREVPVKKAIAETEYQHFEIEIKEDLIKILVSEKPDLVIVADFGWIIPREIFGQPKFGFVVTHQSLLPKYRGTTPIQTAILNGDLVTGVSLIEMDESVDHGPLIAQRTENILEQDTAETLLERLAFLAAQLIIEVIPKYLNQEIQPLEQNHPKATFTKKLAKTDGLIDWSKSAKKIDRQVRAMQPWPKAYTEYKNQTLFIFKGHINSDQYIPDLVQQEGKKTITWSDFLNGQRLTSNQALKIITTNS